jgi:hypothetical protein
MNVKNRLRNSLVRKLQQLYHKVKHATDLLKKLSLEPLEKSFEDVKKLIDANS